jgi:mono/diheme cytochrome c family protein
VHSIKRTVPSAIAWVAILCLSLLPLRAVCAAEPASSPPASALTKDVRGFFASHCFDCHSADDPKGALRLDTLAADFSAPEVVRTWTKILNRLEAGEMPPKDMPRPPAADQARVESWLSGQLLTADLRTLPPKGSLVLRRLNRVQYENTIRDLLSINLELQERLPPDGRAFGFDNVGAALSLSSAQMEAYLEAADAVLDAAIVTRPRPVGIKERISGLRALGEIGHRRNGGVLELEDAAIAFGRNQLYASTEAAPEDGTYRIRASLFGYQNGSEPVEVYVRSIHKTGDDVIGYYQVQPDVPQVLDLKVQLKKEARVAISTLKFRYLTRQRLPAERKEPGLGVQWVEMEGPLLDQWPPAGHRQLFGDLPLVMVNNYFKIMSVQSTEPQADAERLLTAFMRRAYRRPVTAQDVAPVLALVRRQIEDKQSFEESMRVGYKAILCSPNFLFFQERQGEPDEFALASRLSYFLWNTMPNEQLLSLAERGALSRPETLRAEVERLLNNPRAHGFIRNFLGQWLDLRLIDFTTPDPKLYPEYDTALREAAVQETEMFFAELLKRDLSVNEFIDSEFTFLNERLAAHYGIDGVKGTEMRRVALPADSRRGGLMTMASVLKVTANGSYTHPVHRGVWLLRNIVGQPPDPPPPNAGAVEPDLRGAKTIREQLNVHRQDTACAACHVKIDPLGFALEHFDVTGAWREKYRILSGPTLSLSRNGPSVEAAYELADGRPFRDIDELKQLLLENKDQMARCVTEKLLIYATGRGLRFSDRQAVEAIVAQSRSKNHGLRSLVHAIASSPAFLNTDRSAENQSGK